MKILFGANSRNRNIGPEQNFSNLILFSEMNENRFKLKKSWNILSLTLIPNRFSTVKVHVNLTCPTTLILKLPREIRYTQWASKSCFWCHLVISFMLIFSSIHLAMLRAIQKKMYSYRLRNSHVTWNIKVYCRFVKKNLTSTPYVEALIDKAICRPIEPSFPQFFMHQFFGNSRFPSILNSGQF